MNTSVLTLTLVAATALTANRFVTAVGGAPVVIEEGVSGFLVDYPDSPAMASRLVRLFGNPALRERVGEAARKRVVEAFSSAGMVRQMEELYVTLLNGKTHGS